MSRISPQPFRSFAFMVVVAHVVVGCLVWGMLSRGTKPAPRTQPNAPPSAELAWMSPADFQFENSLAPSAAKPSTTPPVTQPTATLAIPAATTGGPITISVPKVSTPVLNTPVLAQPDPKTSVTFQTASAPAKAEPPKEDKSVKSMLAVVGTEKPPIAQVTPELPKEDHSTKAVATVTASDTSSSTPSKPAPGKEEKSTQSSPTVPAVDPPKPSKPALPKAVAIDPAQAIALMKAQQEQEAQPIAKPKPVSDSPPPASSKTIGSEPAGPAQSGPAKIEASVPQPEATPIKAGPPAPMSQASNLPLTHNEDSDFLRFITVSGRNGTKTSTGQNFTEVDRAIRNALLHTWSPPDPHVLPFNQRTAEVNMAIDHAGHVQTFTLVKRSGNETFDQSVRLAGHHLEKVQATLPASFRPEHYEFQVQFHVE